MSGLSTTPIRFRIYERPWYNYPIEEYMVSDGDTILAHLDLGFHAAYCCKVRIIGVDAPETRFLYSREAGQHVQAAVDLWMRHFWNSDIPLVVHSSCLEPKYNNRLLGDVVAWAGPDQKNYSLSEFLLTSNLVRWYDGGTRPEWTEAELRAILEKDPEREVRQYLAS